MMLFGFGRVPGCLCLGALFLWDGWREGRTDRLPAGRLHGRDPVRRSKPLVILGA